MKATAKFYAIVTGDHGRSWHVVPQEWSAPVGEQDQPMKRHVGVTVIDGVQTCRCGASRRAVWSGKTFRNARSAHWRFEVAAKSGVRPTWQAAMRAGNA